MRQADSIPALTRRALLRCGLGAAALSAHPLSVRAAAPAGFDAWRDGFRARALTKGISELAWNEPRRKAYWESELINALRIVDRGWSTPDEMRGSWAGAMGHTQWMPEVWLNVGIDYDGDGKISPFGKPDDALGSTAKFLVNRGKYHRGEHWGYEVRAASGAASGSRTYAAWATTGVSRAHGQAVPQANAPAQIWVPVPGRPVCRLDPNFPS